MFNQDWNVNSEERDFDPVKAFNSRRILYLKLIDCQKHEHITFKKIANVLNDQKSKLLELLSTWLLSINEMPVCYEEIETLSNCSLSEWVSLQKSYQDMIPINQKLRDQQNIAKEEYKKVAPLGILTKIFADELNKIIISEREKALEDINIEVNKLQNQIDNNISQRQQYGYRFMRNCLHNIDQLKTSSVFGNDVEDITRKITIDIINIWKDNISSMHDLINLIDNHSIVLKSIYNINGEYHE